MNRYYFCILYLFATNALFAQQPLEVYILAGQSNMQGHAEVRTFEHIGMDEKTAPLLREMRDASGTPRVCEQVWISSIGHDGGLTERHGNLTAGYGASGNAPKIGPEFTFGIYMQKLSQRPVLIIKTAWGGKSLHTDFRSPSAGPYVFNKQQLDSLRKQGKDIEVVRDERMLATGRYYRHMLEHVRNVLGNLERVCPEYDEQVGYRLAGFVWFQGWNDMVDRGVYPQRDQPGGYDDYADVLTHFIRDVRKDLAVPKLPFVIGVMGAGGPIEEYDDDQRRYANIHREFRTAMAAPALMAEFQGNVAAVKTEDFWDLQLARLTKRWAKVNAKKRALRADKSLAEAGRERALEQFTTSLFTPQELRAYRTGRSNAEYHYLGSAKILAQIGRAFAQAMAEMTLPE